ncbi:uncharacterized protein LOC117114977 [Anneissia japonica]|uniref:uncharacterized protein LOC117114977 n=1 Tax=Anneissia japonica TaxID=1529436 RepID=UPI001425ABCB|nr:uncharacterized protein LOC117114977 [Anneissia japonica]
MRLKKKKVVLVTLTLVLTWFFVIVVIFPSNNMKSELPISNSWNFLEIFSKKRTFNIEKPNTANKGSRIIPEAGSPYKWRVGEILLNSKSEKKQLNPIILGRSQHENINLNAENLPNNQVKLTHTERQKYDLEKDLRLKKIVNNSDLKRIWSIAAKWVTARHIIPEQAPELGDILHAMASRPITKADVGYKGTQLKVTLYLAGGQVVVFKPKRFSRDYVIEGSPVAGYDRHNGEIAAFHLDSGI